MTTKRSGQVDVQLTTATGPVMEALGDAVAKRVLREVHGQVAAVVARGLSLEKIGDMVAKEVRASHNEDAATRDHFSSTMATNLENLHSDVVNLRTDMRRLLKQTKPVPVVSPTIKPTLMDHVLARLRWRFG